MDALKKLAISAGSTNVGFAKVSDMRFDRAFRAACTQNICGKYGTCWMCPPDVGDIDEMIKIAKAYDNIMVFQTISELEDSYDFEGMETAGKNHNKITVTVIEGVEELLGPRATPLEANTKKPLVMGAGACHVCVRCTKGDNLPCAFPHRAIPSLEVYGIAVSELAAASGMKYINGENTVTFFGGVLF